MRNRYVFLADVVGHRQCGVRGLRPALRLVVLPIPPGIPRLSGRRARHQAGHLLRFRPVSSLLALRQRSRSQRRRGCVRDYSRRRVAVRRSCAAVRVDSGVLAYGPRYRQPSDVAGGRRHPDVGPGCPRATRPDAHRALAVWSKGSCGGQACPGRRRRQCGHDGRPGNAGGTHSSRWRPWRFSTTIR